MYVSSHISIENGNIIQIKVYLVISFFAFLQVKSILPDAKPQFFEDYVRFLPFLRINKVCVCYFKINL